MNPVAALMGCFLACAGLLVVATPARAQGEQGPVLRETWDVAYLGGGRAGYVQTIARQFNPTRDNRSFVQTTVKYVLNVKRFDDTIQLGMDIGNIESDNKVISVFMRHYLGKDKKLDLRGNVEGQQLNLMMDGMKPLKPAPWDDRVIGLYAQQTLFRDKKVKAGDMFSYHAFEPSINLVVEMHVKVLEPEQIELFGGKVMRKLLRVEVKPEPVQGVQLPTLILWLDDQLEPVRSQTTLPIGQLTLYRTTREEAIKGSPSAALTDIGIGQLIRLKNKIINPYSVKHARYRVRVKDMNNPATALAHDLRQSVAKVQGDTFELSITAGPSVKEEKAADEFLQSSYFINCEDGHVQKLARLAVGLEPDPWKKALKIEKWVHSRMKPRNHEAMAPADHVARSLEGDCSEYAMLMAALCRAQGIPSKTAMGLIYADLASKGPVFSFHMWTEVWVDGQWFPLDATLGRGHVGATHIKITDHSWHDTRTLTPVLPLYNLLGKLSVEVVRVEY